MSAAQPQSDQMIELIRTMRFPHSSDGYQEEAVDAFLDDIAAWLESVEKAGGEERIKLAPVG